MREIARQIAKYWTEMRGNVLWDAVKFVCALVIPALTFSLLSDRRIWQTTLIIAVGAFVYWQAPSFVLAHLTKRARAILAGLVAICVVVVWLPASPQGVKESSKSIGSAKPQDVMQSPPKDAPIQPAAIPARNETASPKQPAAEAKKRPESAAIQKNSGGINVQQSTSGNNSPIVNSPITIGNLPRRIPVELGSDVRARLAAAPKKVVIVVSADQLSAPAPLPAEFYEALKIAGWTMKYGGVSNYMAFRTPGATYQGAVLIKKGVRSNSEGYQYTADDPIGYLARALELLKVEVTIDFDPKEEDGVIRVDFIGGFPPE